MSGSEVHASDAGQRAAASASRAVSGKAVSVEMQEASEKSSPADMTIVEAAPLRKSVTPLPFPQFYILLLLSALEPLSATSIMPIAVEATKLSGVADDEKSLGYWAGAIEGMFYLTEALCVLQWGRISDRKGRKPVLIVGLLGAAASTVLFGLSRSFWALVGTRMICGLLNGNVGVLKSCGSESLDETNDAKGFSYFSAAFAISAVVGPLIGGLLAHPARFGGIFDVSFWREYPFALGCFAVAMLGVLGVILASFGLKETLPSKVGEAYRPLPDVEDEKAPTPTSPSLSEIAPTVPSLRELVGDRNVRAAIASYFHLAGVDLAWIATFVLWGQTSVANGGLGLTEAQTGLFLALSGGLAGSSQALFFARVSARLGAKRVYRIAMASWMVPFALMPFANLAARHDQDALSVAILCLAIPFLCCGESAFAASFLFVQNAAPKEALGSVNGMAQTVVSLVRAASPPLSSSLFAFGISHHLLGGHLMQVVLICWALFASICVGSWLPESHLQRRPSAS